MPLYEYDCPGCGPFTESRPMARSAAPAPCPACGGGAARVLSATAVGRSRGRRARGYVEPRLVRSDREPPQPKMTAVSSDRPWMIGH